VPQQGKVLDRVKTRLRIPSAIGGMLDLCDIMDRH